MDSVTHALMGYGVYKVVENKKEVQGNEKWFAGLSIVASQIPDIDSVTRLISYSHYLYWHRHITHSIFFAPFLAFILVFLFRLFNKKIDKILSFKVALVNIYIHILFDCFNTWGTAIFAPFTTKRYSFGFLPIIDIIILSIFMIAIIVKKFFPERKVFISMWIVISFYVITQAIQYGIIYNQAKPFYDQIVVSSTFLPYRYTVIGSIDDRVEIYDRTLISRGKKVVLHRTKGEVVEQAMMESEMQAIANFSPFYVIRAFEETEDSYLVEIFDPRFYRRGNYFLRAEIVISKMKEEGVLEEVEKTMEEVEKLKEEVFLEEVEKLLEKGVLEEWN